MQADFRSFALESQPLNLLQNWNPASRCTRKMVVNLDSMAGLQQDTARSQRQFDWPPTEKSSQCELLLPCGIALSKIEGFANQQAAAFHRDKEADRIALVGYLRRYIFQVFHEQQLCER